MRKRILSVILAASMMLALTPNTAMAAKMDGESLQILETAEKMGTADSSSNMEGLGTETSPYRIKNAEQLRSFADMVNGVGSAPNTGLCAVLTCNIDLSGICSADIGSWTPIGTNANPYTGIFDGGSFAITGLYYHKSNSSYAGLFGNNAGIIKNLGVTGADVSAGSYTGGVCGYNSGTITGCYNATPVKGTNYTGGICGYNDIAATVSICYNTGAVSGSKYVGGICGYNKNAANDCYNMGAVNGDNTSIGGICGYNRALVSNCFNTGTVNGGGKNYIGSVCGYNSSGSSFINCYYLITGEEKGNYGIGMTQEQFASGEVCWLLNGGKSENVVWHQTCGGGFPAFGGKVVYQVRRPKTSGSSDEMIVAYTNEEEKKQASNNTPAVENDSENTDGHVYQEPEWEWKEYSFAKAVFTCQECGEKLSLEASVSKKITEATCAKEGKTVYTASVDRGGETYTDKKTVKLKKPEHQPLVQIPAQEATCTEAGIKRGCWECPDCGEYFADQGRTEVLSRKKIVDPAKGHQYGEPNWKWADDYTTATATFTCTACSQSTEPKNAKITSKTNATCDKPGDTVYKAVVKFNGKDYPDEKPVNNQTIPHSYKKPTWTWTWADDDNTTATATFVCKKCSHTETETDNAPTLVTITPPTCTKAGQTKYEATVTVTFGAKKYSNTKTKSLDKLEHSYGAPEKWNWSSDFSKATAVFKCDTCKKTVSKQANITQTITPATNCSTPGNITYTAVVTLNDGTEYPDERNKVIQPKHTPILVPAEKAKCDQPGYKKHWKCGVCSALFSDSAGKQPIDEIPSIPATGHTLKHIQNDIYICTVCNQQLKVTIESDGTTSISSVDEDTVIIQNESENDDGADCPDEETQDEAESVDEESASPPDLEETQEDSEPQDTEEQDEESIQNDQDEEDEQNEDESNNDDIPDMPENAERYGLIYPDVDETKANPVTEDAWEGSAVNLRTESARNGAAQTVQAHQQQGYPLWVSVTVLVVLAGMVMFFILRRKDN